MSKLIFEPKNQGEIAAFVQIDEDFGDILLSSVRYGMGRRTTFPGTAVSFIKPLLPYLSNRVIKVMERDIRERGEDPLYKDAPYGDLSIDAPVWLDLLDSLRKEIKRRDEIGEWNG